MRSSSETTTSNVQQWHFQRVLESLESVKTLNVTVELTVFWKTKLTFLLLNQPKLFSRDVSAVSMLARDWTHLSKFCCMTNAPASAMILENQATITSCLYENELQIKQKMLQLLLYQLAGLLTLTSTYTGLCVDTEPQQHTRAHSSSTNDPSLSKRHLSIRHALSQLKIPSTSVTISFVFNIIALTWPIDSIDCLSLR